jgi:prepilin peptidase CpaA
VFPFMVLGVGVQAWFHGWHGVAQSLEGFALGAVVFGVLAAMGGMGMGDVKLLAGIGAWIGPSQLVLALVLTGLAGGLMALGWALIGGFVGELFKGSGDLLLGWRKRGTLAHPELKLSNPLARKMPYAPAIAIGTLISFFAP